MYCSSCGTQTADASKFCSECGQPLAVNARTTQAPEPPPTPEPVVIGGKTYTPASPQAVAKYQGLYSHKGKWYRIQDGNAVREPIGAWQKTPPAVRVLVIGGAIFAALYFMALINEDANYLVKTVTGVDVRGDAAANSSEITPIPQDQIPDRSWIPSGFSLSPDPQVAFKFLPTGSFDCGYYDICSGIEVVSEDGCPNGVFVEMARVNASGALFDNSNDIGPGIRAGQRAEIVVGWLGAEIADGTEVQITDVSCMG